MDLFNELAIFVLQLFQPVEHLLNARTALWQSGLCNQKSQQTAGRNARSGQHSSCSSFFRTADGEYGLGKNASAPWAIARSGSSGSLSPLIRRIGRCANLGSARNLRIRSNPSDSGCFGSQRFKSVTMAATSLPGSDVSAIAARELCITRNSIPGSVSSAISSVSAQVSLSSTISTSFAIGVLREGRGTPLRGS